MDFEQLGRKELQALAKQYKIKANQTNAALVEALKHALLQDYETSMIEEDDEEEIAQPEKTTECEEITISAPSVIEEVVSEPEPIVEAKDPLPEIENQIIEHAEEIPVSRVTGRKRKAVTIVTPGAEEKMVSGPFSIGNVVVENNSPLFARKKVPETSVISNEITSMPKKFVLEKKAPSDWKVGDKVQVLVDSVWITSVIKRVNKASFRVQMNSGEEATVKPADVMEMVEQEQQEEADEVTQEQCMQQQEESVPLMEESINNLTEDTKTSLHENEINDASLILDDAIVPDNEPEEVEAMQVDEEPVLNEQVVMEQVEEKSTTTPRKSRVPPKSPSFSRHSIAAMGTPTTSVRSAVKSARKSTSFAAATAASLANAAAVTPRRASVQPSWNSSTKPTFHMGSATKIAQNNLSAKKESKTPGSERKRLPITPSRASLVPATNVTAPAPSVAVATVSVSNTTGSVSVPAIVPKMNAAQRKRLEALQKKMEAEKSLGQNTANHQNTAFTLASGTGSASLYNQHNTSSQPPLKKARTTPMSTSNHITAANSKSQDRTKISGHLPHVATVKPKVQFSAVLEDEAKIVTAQASNGASNVAVKPKLSTTTVSSSNVSAAAPKKTTTPNFDRMHQKTFEKQKSLTSCVARDTKINKNMDSAFAKASEGKSLATEEKLSTTALLGRENVAPTNNKSTFVTKRKAHVAFAEEKKRKESDHLSALLIQETNLENPLIDVESLGDQQPQKKLKTLSGTTTTTTTAGVVVNKRKTMGVSVAEKTTAAAMASKSAILSRKSEVAPNSNHRKSIRL